MKLQEAKKEYENSQFVMINTPLRARDYIKEVEKINAEMADLLTLYNVETEDGEFHAIRIPSKKFNEVVEKIDGKTIEEAMK